VGKATKVFPLFKHDRLDNTMCEKLEKKSQDPLVVLGSDIFFKVLECLNPEEISRVFLVNKGWRAVCTHNRVWEPLHALLVKDKLFPPQITAKYQAPGAPRHFQRFYAGLLNDSKRTTITLEELCTYRWRMRFKEAAGPQWLAIDPFWNGREPMQRLFHRDGVMAHGTSDDPIQPLFLGYETHWRMCKTRYGVRGEFIKVNHWPSLIVSRDPDTWGWRMENEWVVDYYDAKCQEKDALVYG
jgi:hypothetical protein